MKSVSLLIFIVLIFVYMPVKSQTISGTVYESKQVTPASRSHLLSKEEPFAVKGVLQGVELKLIYGYDRISNDRTNGYWESEGKSDENGNFTIISKQPLKDGVRYSVFGKKEGYINLFFTLKYDKKVNFDSLIAVMVPLMKARVNDK